MTRAARPPSLRGSTVQRRARGRYVAVPVRCAVTNQARCLGAVRVRNSSRREIGTLGFSLRPGNRTLLVRVYGATGRRVTPSVKTYQPNGRVRTSQRAMTVR